MAHYRGFSVSKATKRISVVAAAVLTLTGSVSLAGRAAEKSQTTARSLRGNPAFREEQLPPDVRVWYARMWSGLRSPNPTPNLAKMGASGDIWELSRTYNAGITALLAVLRVTGDLRILDEIDRSMQRARAELKDYNDDGFLNWRFLDTTNASLTGDDVGSANMWDMETHALVACVAYAYRSNEDLNSPAGVPYAERAAFWQGYLKNHFEAKWRKRNNKPTGYPIVERELVHPFAQFIRFHHYMSKLTGDESYAKYGRDMAKRLMAVTKEAETPTGPAFVWPHFVRFDKKTSQPTTYARYTLGAAQDLSLEGFGPYADAKLMKKYARTVSELIMLDGSRSFSKDVSGERERAGFVSNPHQGVDSKPSPRPVWGLYSSASLAGMAAWDETGKIQRITEEVYKKVAPDPEKPHVFILPAHLVFAKLYQSPAAVKPAQASAPAAR